jgi:hypothetical protein
MHEHRVHAQRRMKLWVVRTERQQWWPALLSDGGQNQMLDAKLAAALDDVLSVRIKNGKIEMAVTIY